MKETTEKEVEELLKKQRGFFSSHQTREHDFRISNLKKFREAIKKYEKQITEALWKDLHKSYEEAYLTEISIVLKEIDNHIKNLRKWSRDKKVPTPMHLQPSSGRIVYEPLGVALIIAPWNYPFQLLMNPLVGAISSGCCAILKPSEFTPHTSGVMEEMICETFPDEYISVVQGGKDVGAMLLKKRYDIIFFTGSTEVGKIVMKAAAEYLTPVILELGGKSPCIVDENANLDIAAKRIAWGKSINAGQTCIAPDYLLVHESVKEELIEKIDNSWKNMFGEDVRQSHFYPRIINDKSYERLVNLMQDGKVRAGGETNQLENFIAPTVVDDVKPGDRVMKEEIFGPVLPIMKYTAIEEAVEYINGNDKPLALYYFGREKAAKEVITRTTSGGACINDTLMHITNPHLPFGGVGNSGIGKYHGKESFLVFCNQRSIVNTPTWVDLPFKYAPFKYFSFIKRFL